MHLVAVLEGLLFIAGDDGLDLTEASTLLQVDLAQIEQLIEELKRKYQIPESGLTLKKVAGQYKLTTKPEHLEYYRQFTKLEVNNSLTPASLEVLAIVAYKQPITRIEVDDIRGVSSSYIIRRLVNLNLIKDAGRSDTLGRPILYKTTDYFLDYFNINHLDELPQIELGQQNIDSNQNLYYTKYQED